MSSGRSQEQFSRLHGGRTAFGRAHRLGLNVPKHPIASQLCEAAWRGRAASRPLACRAAVLKSRSVICANASAPFGVGCLTTVLWTRSGTGANVCDAGGGSLTIGAG